MILNGQVHLPTGLWRDGIRCQDATIHPLSGADEERLGDAARWDSPAARVSAVLAASVTRIGDLCPVDLDAARALSVLDRDALLIALRQRMYGDRVQSTVACPADGCHKPVDIDFRLSDLPIPEHADSAPSYTVTLEDCVVTYRLPCGGDQEAVAAAAQSDADGAAGQILRRCVEGYDALHPQQIEQVRAEMERRDAQIDTDFAVQCPECGNTFTVQFDIQDFFLKELSSASAQLYQQVHNLAWYYHWGEADILALPYHKRQIYLALLADAISAMQEVAG